MTLDYKIGNINGDPLKESKFIVAKEKDLLAFYSANLINNLFETPLHAEIAKCNGLSEHDVLGGGKSKYRLEERCLHLYGTSGTFGSVPVEALEGFGKLLADYLRANNLDVSTININPSVDKVKQQYRWEKLGFSQPGEPKIIEVAGTEKKKRRNKK